VRDLVSSRVQVLWGGASLRSVLDMRTMIGAVGAPKRVTTCSIHAAVGLLSHPRYWPQSAQ